MKEFLNDFKNSKFLKFYLFVFSLINIIYAYFVVTRYQYIERYSLDGTIEKYHFEYLSGKSGVIHFLESLIVLIVLAYFIKVVIKVIIRKDVSELKDFLIINISSIIGFAFIHFLIGLLLSTPRLPLMQVLGGPLSLTFIGLIYFIYKALFVNSKSVNL